jgi:hypothetical protein
MDNSGQRQLVVGPKQAKTAPRLIQPLFLACVYFENINGSIRLTVGQTPYSGIE